MTIQSPTRRIVLGSRAVLVFDDLFSEDFVDAFSIMLQRQPYKKKPSFDNEFFAPFNTEALEQIPELLEKFEDIIKKHLKDVAAKQEKQLLSHGYCAAIRSADHTQIHQDIDCDDCVTFLVYGNHHWTADWGGETHFYDENQDCIGAVSPRPGRVVFFNASLFHRTGVPANDVPAVRYAMSVFYRCKRKLNSGSA